MVDKTFDKAGRLWKIKTRDETTVYAYNLNGAKKSVTYPDGTTQSYIYDGKNQVTRLVNKGGTGNVISSYTYTYDGARNQLTKIEAKGKTEYTYDALNRLSTVTEPDGLKTSYTYDKAGNRITEKKEIGNKLGLTQYIYNAQNRLTSTLSSDGTETTFIYDGNGNMISRMTNKAVVKLEIDRPELGSNISGTDTNGSNINQGSNLPSFGLTIKKDKEAGTGALEVTLYTYNHFNQLTQLKGKDTTSTYVYNAQGYRVEKNVNKITKGDLYDKTATR